MNEEATRIALMCYYLYFSPFLLPSQHSELLEIAKNYISMKSQPHAWIECDAFTWGSMKRVFDSWGKSKVTAKRVGERIDATKVQYDSFHRQILGGDYKITSDK